jgi:hypothetical protein
LVVCGPLENLNWSTGNVLRYSFLVIRNEMVLGTKRSIKKTGRTIKMFLTCVPIFCNVRYSLMSLTCHLSFDCTVGRLLG